MMVALSCKQIQTICQGQLIGAASTMTIEHVVTDSRQADSHSVFFALAGHKQHGHAFVADVMAQGCQVIVVESQFDQQLLLNWVGSCIVVPDSLIALGQLAAFCRQQYLGKVISVTGSCGKTTSKQMLQAIFAKQYNTHSTAGNFNNYIGLPLTIFSQPKDTQVAIYELGANAVGEIGYLTDIAKPDVAILLNANPAHIEGFGSLANVQKGKGEIISHSLNNSCIILNKDDEAFSYWLQLVDQRPCVSVSLTDSSADLYASDIQLNASDTHAKIHYQQSCFAIRINQPGQPMLLNALAVIAVALQLGVSISNIQQALSEFKNCQGRLQQLPINKNLTLWDDTYNANPASIKSAIDVLSLQSGFKILVLGDMAEMGEYVEQSAQDIANYCQGKIDCLLSFGKIAQLSSRHFHNAQHFMDKTSLAAWILQQTQPCSVLVKGSRSAQMETVIQIIKESST